MTEVDRDKNTYRSCIWLYRVDAAEAFAFTSGPADASPTWSPDGRRLAFLGVRQDDEEPQVYVMPAAGGEARRVSRDLKGAAGLSWSPDGTSVAVIAWRDDPEPETTDLWDAVSAVSALPEEGPRTADVFITSRIKYRFDGVGYALDRRRHVCVVPVGDEPAEGRFVTAGAFDVSLVRWHPDGQRLAFVAGGAGGDIDESWNTDVYEVAVDGGEPRRLIHPGGRAFGLAWSPKGDHLAVVAEDETYGPATDLHLTLYDGDGGGGRRLLADLDRPIGPGLLGDTTPLPDSAPIVWRPDGQSLVVQVQDRGCIAPYEVGLDGRGRRLVPEDWRGNCASVALGGGRLWAVADDAGQPAELCELVDGGAPRACTDLNRSRVAGWGAVAAQPITYRSQDGRFDIEAFVTLPHGFEEGQRYALFLLVHGGPHGAFGYTFSHEVQRQAAAGRVVLQVNPRGSVGYGQAFTRGCVSDWGGGDYEDIMAGVDAVIARGWVDPGRMAVNGISYGGYMTSWIITHTDRFACGIPEMLVSDLISMWGTSDIGWFLIGEENGGNPWDGWQELWSHSPLASAGRCRTPALIIEGEIDYRCPIGQGEELYTALRRQDVEAAMVRLQGASHIAAFVGPPRQRLARLALIERWLVRHGVADRQIEPVTAETI